MRFEWDPAKNESNIRRHGFDFEDAHEIFEGPVLTARDDRFEYGEIRLIGIGLVRGLVVVMVFTERDDDIIRVISLRRARKNERQKFYKFFKDRLGPSEDDV